jgi:hypothetical protein
VELAKLVVEKGANVNAVGTDNGHESTPLWFAARAMTDDTEGAVALATLLVEKGADVRAVGADDDGYESTPLWWAASAVSCEWQDAEEAEGAAELAKLLVRKGADVNAFGAHNNGKSTPLWRAAFAVSDGRGCALQLATLLVEQGADINAVGSRGGITAATPLWLAAYEYMIDDACEGGFDMAKLLVEKGAGVNTVGEDTGFYGNYKCAPLWFAAKAVYNGRARAVEMATLLVHKGADANEVEVECDEHESTPLRLAAEAVRDGKAGGPELARLLISAGARLADDEKDEFQGFVDQLPLCLALLERTSTSLTVSWLGGLAGARGYSVSLELPGGNTMSSTRQGLTLPHSTVLVRESFCVQFLTSDDPSIY